jgi:hypothetical protein
MKPEPSKKKHFKYYLKCIIVSIIIMIELHCIFLLLYFISGSFFWLLIFQKWSLMNSIL